MRPTVDIEAVYRKFVLENLNDRERRAMEVAINQTKTADDLSMEDISIKIRIFSKLTAQKSIKAQKHIDSIKLLD